MKNNSNYDILYIHQFFKQIFIGQLQSARHFFIAECITVNKSDNMFATKRKLHILLGCDKKVFGGIK